jgi:hypothetical protein
MIGVGGIVVVMALLIAWAIFFVFGLGRAHSPSPRVGRWSRGPWRVTSALYSAVIRHAERRAPRLA